jgi:cellulose biosynthesis protein BcsQ
LRIADLIFPIRNPQWFGGAGVSSDPYLLAIGSHKGGTGRTTAVLALAWLWGNDGLRVTLADADPSAAAGLVALDPSGACPWPNVRYVTGLPEPGDPALDADFVVIDCPALLDPLAPPLLRRVHGVVLTCPSDPLALRTVPAAAGVLGAARLFNPELELLGMLINRFDAADAVQAPVLDRLRQAHGELLLEPPVPDDPAVRDWPLTPGAGLPLGLAADAFAAVAGRLRERARRPAAVAAAAPADRREE